MLADGDGEGWRTSDSSRARLTLTSCTRPHNARCPDVGTSKSHDAYPGLSLSLSLALSLSLSLSLSLTHSLTRSLSLSHSLTRSLSHSLSLSQRVRVLHLPLGLGGAQFGSAGQRHCISFHTGSSFICTRTKHTYLQRSPGTTTHKTCTGTTINIPFRSRVGDPEVR